MSSEKLNPLSFKVNFTNVLRDCSQSLFANRIPLDDVDALGVFKLYEQLLKLNAESEIFKATSVEIGGAQPQVDSIYLNKDYTQTIRRIRENFSGSLRPLERGTNVFMLKPSSQEDIDFIMEQLVRDTAPKNLWDKNNQEQKLLDVKVFDSQGDLAEVKPAVEKLIKLRNQGAPIGIEIAIPYSTNVGCEKDSPYEDDVFIAKIVEAAKYLQTLNIPLSLCRVSLKDMVGEMSKQDAERLMPKVIAALKENKLNIPLGLHLHDTGLAEDAYAAAINICKQNNWSIDVDTVDGKDTGFVSTLALNDKLKKEYGFDLGLNAKQIDIIEKISAQTDKLLDKYKLARVDVDLDKRILRECKIPGGGFTSFVNAVKTRKVGTHSNIAKELGVSNKEAVEIAAYALKVVSKIMGYPFSVTPGFQNKQNAALNLLKNMIEQEYFKGCSGITAIKDKLLGQELSDAQVKSFFLKDLDEENKKFLAGKMPQQVHKVVREQIPLRSGTSIEGIASKLPAIKAMVNKLDQEGYIGTNEGQKALARYEIYQESYEYALQNSTKQTRKGRIKEATKIALSRSSNEVNINARAKEMAINDMVARGIVIGNPDELYKKVTRTWYREPLACDFADRAEYDRAMAKFRRAMNPDPQSDKEVEEIRNLLWQNQTEVAEAKQRLELLAKREIAQIRNSVLQYMQSNISEVLNTLKSLDDVEKYVDGYPPQLVDMMKKLHEYQATQIKNDLARGSTPLYSLQESLKLTLILFAEELSHLVSEENQEIKLSLVKEVRSRLQKEMEASELRTEAPGTLKEFKVRKGEFVEEGQVVAETEAMKMALFEYAKASGIVADICIENGKAFDAGQILIKFNVANPLQDKKDNNIVYQLNDTELKNVKTLIAKSLSANENELNQIKQALLEQIRIIERQLQPTAAISGYNSPTLDFTENSKQKAKESNVVHIIGNRGVCATKIVSDLKQAGENDIRILLLEGDKSTPLGKTYPKDKAIEISSYINQDEMINVLTNLARNNPDKVFAFHPGYGYLSEKDDFVAKIENLKSQGVHNVLFVGPESKPMALCGGKASFRDLVDEVAPELNPFYFKNEKITADNFAAYLNTPDDIKASHNLDIICREAFAKVKAMGGDVMIKAAQGGGGKGIEGFKYNNSLSEEENYKKYLETNLKNIKYSEEHFNSCEMLTESRIRGNTHHIEIQLAVNNQGGISLGFRNCSAQNGKQKFSEVNVIKGDYSEELTKKINQASEKIAKKMSEVGYKGLATLEMLVLPETEEVVILEVNTRIQVEHPVTEQDIKVKTRKSVSLPVYHYHLVNDNETPEKIMEQLYDISKDQLRDVATPGTERIVHFRINSREIDLIQGKTSPRFVTDAMWPKEVTEYIHQTTGAIITQGGLGDGNQDSQIGSIVGRKDQVIEAANKLNDLLELSRVFDRSNDRTNLAINLACLNALFTEEGKLNPKFSTSSVDDLLDGVRAKNTSILNMNPANDNILLPGSKQLSIVSLEQNINFLGDEQLKACKPRTQLDEARATLTALGGKKDLTQREMLERGRAAESLSLAAKRA